MPNLPSRIGRQSVRLLDEPAGYQSVHHVFPLFTEQRDEFARTSSREAGIGTGIHYPIPVHLQPGYRFLAYKEGDLPETERACREVLSLPMYPELRDDAVMRIADAVRQFCREPVAAHS